MAAQVKVPPVIGDLINPLAGQEAQAAQDIPGAATAASSVGDFLSRLSQANTWIRVGEVVAGLILLGIGLNAMLKGKPFQIVTGTAGRVGKVAML